MRSPRRPQSVEQLDLFQPQAVRPSWDRFPPQAQETVTRLLAKMLREHLRRASGMPGQNGETVDE